MLGPASAPGIDMLSIIRKYHLPTEFPRDVLDQVKGIPETVDARQSEGREDLRGEFIVTIDPDDARDFDDAIHVEKTGSGWRLGVTSPTSPLMWSPTVRWIEKRAGAETAFICPIA